MTCIIGDPDGAFVHFAPLTTSDNSLLVLGLYPNAKADIKRVCATEHEMLDLLKFDNVDWVDFVPLSSRSTNAVIDQRIVESFADDEELVRDYCRRFAEHLSADANAMGCVYIAGGTCQAAFEKAIKMEIITREVCLSATHDISIMSIGGKRFIVLEHAPHPSWHLVMGREPKAVRIFKETMCTLNGMRCWCAGGNDIAPCDLKGSCFASIFGRGSFVKRISDPAFEDRIIELFVEQLGRSPELLRGFLRKNDVSKLTSSDPGAHETRSLYFELSQKNKISSLQMAGARWTWA